MKFSLYLFLYLFSGQIVAAVCESKVEQDAISGTIYESTFNKHGGGCFYAKSSDEFDGGFDFYVLLDSGKKFRFPRSSGMNYWVKQIESISFADFNDDGYCDVAVIVKQMTAKDDIRGLIFYRGRSDFSGYTIDEELESSFAIGEYQNISDIKYAIQDAIRYRRDRVLKKQ